MIEDVILPMINQMSTQISKDSVKYWLIEANPNPMLFVPLIKEIVTTSSHIPPLRLIKNINLKEVDGELPDTYKSNIIIKPIVEDRTNKHIKYSPPNCIPCDKQIKCDNIGNYRVWYNISKDGLQPMAMYTYQCGIHIEQGIGMGFRIEQLDFMLDE